VSLVTKLNLCDNEISEIPENIAGIGGECSQFEIRNNKLKCLPSSMSGLVGLKVIDASNNEISEVQELDLSQLADLNLANNRLSKLPNMSNLLALSRLTLSNNQVELVCMCYLQLTASFFLFFFLFSSSYSLLLYVFSFFFSF
jgi:Leucine-rich repeat (LRR) protein